MSSLLLLNGSPRGPRSNSMRMLSKLAEGWAAAGGDEPVALHLAKSADFDRAVAEFATAGTVVLGTPLYTDSMPGLVMRFIEQLEPYVGSDSAPRLGFLVQSGFPEAAHSRGLERYFVKLAARLGAPYAGTIVKGSGESLQAMPDQALGGLWKNVHALGEQLAMRGEFDAQTLAKVAGKEHMTPAGVAFASVMMKVPLSQFYWNGQLKKNGAWDRRFAAPYAKGATQ
ncbi:MAG: NAD(P)H-dependent oxidoreductase [Coriobacteriia bacterium]|nr:NAD(P)H-dependent oxidoreductase [Coriobacteriia bacterium]